MRIIRRRIEGRNHSIFGRLAAEQFGKNRKKTPPIFQFLAIIGEFLDVRRVKPPQLR